MRVHDDQHVGTAGVAGPIRTCVGCRRRDIDSRLLRIVHDPQAAALSPDPRRRAEGRGAWVHRDERCITTALDRKAFIRALRVAGNVSQDAISEVLETMPSRARDHPPAASVGRGSTRKGTDQTR
ncbi:YlxR family protein [Rhodococcus sp. IEGM 1408]|uniref:YlxR family protein n=1 Tax=Rhodococcus sp. IEGM 1408 TaxID=3082220 RepID=UPI0029550D40|nr:YlxR family protein [Rhodococcus sp. IEGM 1408]MDV8000425.1 YlxR family protein [Rhodococcus sp. IEGM 1408]